MNKFTLFAALAALAALVVFTPGCSHHDKHHRDRDRHQVQPVPPKAPAKYKHPAPAPVKKPVHSGSITPVAPVAKPKH